QVRLLLEHRGDRLGAVGDGTYGESCEAQARGQQITDVRLVVDDEDARSGGHALHSLRARCKQAGSMRDGQDPADRAPRVAFGTGGGAVPIEDEAGGDPACWLSKLCPECGAMLDGPAAPC